MADRIREADEQRQQTTAQIEAAQAKATAEKAERDAADEEQWNAAKVKHAESIEMARKRLEFEEEQDREAHEHVKEEISNIAKQLLEINAKINEKLTALANI